MIAVTILGNNSAVPSHNRHPTAQVLQTAEQLILIDCGEGTQMQMSRYKIKRSRINHIFISHLHGDHYFGLIGLLNSLALNNRLTDLHIYAPEKLQSIIEIQTDAAGSGFPFRMFFHKIDKEEILFEDKKLSVECFAVNHRIECWGFLFKEKKNHRKINIDKIKNYKVPKQFYENLHRGEDYINEKNEVIKNDLLTIPVDPPKSYAYCADTAFYEPIAEKIKGVDLMYHESTYLADLEKKAQLRFHSTSKQAAKIAEKAGAKKLLLGHFSSMYETLEKFKEEACEIFENTEIAEEGTCYLA
ncbi:MAG TPA: ribonuclease Z [Hanamia sp.]|nr:ribonuclease Z [Hanamia sp.]